MLFRSLVSTANYVGKVSWPSTHQRILFGLEQVANHANAITMQVDNFRMYTNALTAAQVLNLYNNHQ